MTKPDRELLPPEEASSLEEFHVRRIAEQLQIRGMNSSNKRLGLILLSSLLALNHADSPSDGARNGHTVELQKISAGRLMIRCLAPGGRRVPGAPMRSQVFLTSGEHVQVLSALIGGAFWSATQSG